MIEDFLKLYNDELRELRKQGEAFAESHPKIAGRLRLGQGSVEDPFVGRLLESFAFLTARIRYKMDEELDCITENLINLLYPHYLLPVPSCSTLQFLAKNQLDQAYTIPAKTKISTSPIEEDACLFTTSYPVTLLPINLSHALYKRKVHIKPKQHALKDLKSCLCLKIASNHIDTPLSALNLNNIRFFIKAESPHTHLIYELLLKDCREILINWSDANGKTISIPTDSIKPVGFSDHEGLFPYPENSFKGYRLLTEFFTFPEKFFYIDLTGLDKVLHEDMGKEIELYFFFDQSHPELEKIINTHTFALGCTPIVNIFEQICAPITIDQKQSEYHVIPSLRKSLDRIEIYSIQSIDINFEKGSGLKFAPYFGHKFEATGSEKKIYWHSSKKSCFELGENYIPGFETFLNFSHLNYLQDLNDNMIVTPKVLCTNRELPTRLTFGGNKPTLDFNIIRHELVESMQNIGSLTTPRYRDKNKIGSADLVSHLFLNQISFENSHETINTLKNILALYHYDNDYDNAQIQSGLVSAEIKRVTERHPESLKQGFCRGIEFTLTIDEKYFPDNSAYLFGSVLHEFLTKSCSINSFVRLILKSKQRGDIHSWKPKLGIKPTL